MSRAPTDPDGTAAAGSADALRPVVAGVVEQAGFVLDDLEVRTVGRRRLVRVVVDTADVPAAADPPAGGVDLDAVAATSRGISAAVDAHEAAAGDVVDDAWTLEVTTPGTDRPLARPHHWRRAWLRRVAVEPVTGAGFTGRVGAVQESADPGAGAVTLLVDGDLRRVALADVRRAVVEVEFKPAPEADVAALRADRTGGTGPTGTGPTGTGHAEDGTP